MNNISTPEYRSFLEALLRVEGKTIEDEPCNFCGSQHLQQNYNMHPKEFAPIYAHRLLAGLGKVHGEWSMTCWGNDICKIGGGIEIEALKPIHQHPIEVITKLTELLTQPE